MCVCVCVHVCVCVTSVTSATQAGDQSAAARGGGAQGVGGGGREGSREEVAFTWQKQEEFQEFGLKQARDLAESQLQ